MDDQGHAQSSHHHSSHEQSSQNPTNNCTDIIFTDSSNQTTNNNSTNKSVDSAAQSEMIRENAVASDPTGPKDETISAFMLTRFPPEEATAEHNADLEKIEAPDFTKPYIVLIGAQSSGKSSILERLVGWEFLPVGPHFKTRRPLILQLIHTTNDASARAQFQHLKDIKFEDFEQVRQEIDNMTAKNEREPIYLTIHSSKVPNWTLIDLPGMTPVPAGNPPSDIETQIEGMTFEYIFNQNCIILAVLPATSGPDISDTIKYADQFDPDGVRTIPVVTKVDLLREGTEANEIFKKRFNQVREDSIGLVNRSQSDITEKKTMESALEAEQKFFFEHATLKDMRDRMGLVHLKKVLTDRIEKQLRGSKEAIQNDGQRDDVIDSNKIFRPITILPNFQPLKECVLSISGFQRPEKDIIKVIIQRLGGRVQDCRVSKEQFLACTHLVANVAEGQEYDAATEWGIPVVTKSWVYQCARTRRKAPEKNFCLQKMSESGVDNDGEKARLFHATGKGIQPTGLTVGELAHLQIHTEGAKDVHLNITITGPEDPKILLGRNGDFIVDYWYTPTMPGVYMVSVGYNGQPIKDSPFMVMVGTANESIRLGPAAVSQNWSAGSHGKLQEDFSQARNQPISTIIERAKTEIRETVDETNKASEVFEIAPTLALIMVVKKKIRNIIKRKKNIENNKEIFKKVGKLDIHQKTALGEYDCVVSNLDCLVEILKKMETIIVASKFNQENGNKDDIMEILTTQQLASHGITCGKVTWKEASSSISTILPYDNLEGLPVFTILNSHSSRQDSENFMRSLEGTTGNQLSSDSSATSQKGILDGLKRSYIKTINDITEKDHKKELTISNMLISSKHIFITIHGDSVVVFSRGSECHIATKHHQPINLEESRTSCHLMPPSIQIDSPKIDIFMFERSPADEFAVLACQGILKVMTCEEVCDVVRKLMSLSVKVSEICRIIVDSCMSKGSRDDISILIVTFPGYQISKEANELSLISSYALFLSPYLFLTLKGKTATTCPFHKGKTDFITNDITRSAIKLWEEMSSLLWAFRDNEMKEDFSKEKPTAFHEHLLAFGKKLLDEEEEQVESWHEAWKAFAKDRPRAGFMILKTVDNQTKALLVEENGGKLGFVKGGLHFEEMVTEGSRREVMEETRLDMEQYVLRECRFDTLDNVKLGIARIPSELEVATDGRELKSHH